MAFDLVAAFVRPGEPFYTANVSPGEVALDAAPQQITLRFSPGVEIDPTSLAGISVVRSGRGGDAFEPSISSQYEDSDVTIGSITVNDAPNQNEVVIRFAETLPDDTYRINVGVGLKTVPAPGATTGDSVNATSFDVRLNLGAYVVSVVPQPVTRSEDGLVQDRDSIVVYFNENDPLAKASAETVSLYRLYEVDANGDDVAAGDPAEPNWVEPDAVAYSAAAGTATLTFAEDTIAAGKLYRLQIGGAPGVVAAAAIDLEVGDTHSSFSTAQDLGALGAAGLVVRGRIIAPTTVSTPAGDLAFPTQNGSIDSPGHRDIPSDSGSHGGAAVGLENNTEVERRYYNFRSDYGTFNGVPQTNAITETQKQRAREIFELFSRYSGIRFVEHATAGITIATGDIRVAESTLPPQSVAGIGGGSLTIMNASLDWGQSEYGGQWFRVAMHEIGHALGLSHSYDLPSVMGKGLPGEVIFPADYDIEQLRQIFPANGSDVDVYQFTLASAGKLTAETLVARPGLSLYNPDPIDPAMASKLDALLTLYRQDPTTGVREMIARNDDSFGRDAFIGLDLSAGTYFLAVSSTGNDRFNPEVSDSGYGGRSDGAYELALGFEPASVAENTILDTSGTPLDGDRDGEAGGTFQFWFKTAAATNDAATNRTLFVDKASAAVGSGTGTIADPFKQIDDALAAAIPGTIVRIVGNPANAPYLVGTKLDGQPLEDGATFNVPKDVTVMIDAGAVFKLRAANIDVGSSSPLVDRSGAAIQVLGIPGTNVKFTSYHDDSIGGNSDQVGPAVTGGQWGGIVLRQDSDALSKKAFVNSIAQAAINYGGGQVRVDSQLDSFAPITLQTTRPTLVFNTIQFSAGAAISATPNSFEESDGRVGPELRGNRLLGNSINGLFIKVRTALGEQPDKLDLPARLKSTDVVYVLQDNLLIDGGVGGYLHDGASDTARRSGRLAIDPGVVIKLQGARIELERGTAQLIAEGVAGQTVIFTSLGDRRFGAGGTFDTNGNLPDLAQAGDWGGIMVNAGAKASIDYAYLGYGGGQTPIEGSFDNFNVIEVHQGDLRVAHSRIENNASGASVGGRNARGGNAAATVFVRGAQPVILGNDFRDNRGAVVSINANSLTDAEVRDPGRMSGAIDRDARYDDNRGPLVRDNRISYVIDAAKGRPAEGATSGMEVRGEEIVVESVWDDVDIVHVLKSEIVVQNFHTFTGIRLMSQANSSLVVKLLGANAGFTAAGYGLDIDDRIGGTVQVVGQPGYPVVLTSLKDDSVGASVDPLGRTVKDVNNDGTGSSASPGDWRSLQFLPMSNDRNVAIVQEVERASTQGIDVNATPGTAESLGVLAPNFATGTNSWESAQEKSGDDVRRLGFEVHGFIATDAPGDVDVYTFTGYAGSEVWIDIDKTSSSLDTIVELLDAAGNVRARSADSQGDGVLLSVGTTLSGEKLARDAWNGGDHYSVNPKDAGMRVTLPRDGQPVGTAIQYFIRVRSQPRYEPTTTKAAYEADLADPSKVTSGATSGAYELRVRLRQRDEKPGSTVRYADIRYPTIGLDVQGLPRNSPLVGETGENAGGSNETFASAQYLGNLLQTDRNTISIAGTISDAGDVDWYTFALNYEQLQSIGGVNGGEKTWATVFDIDYGDGIRGDLTIAVYSSEGRLLYVGRDSNIAADQPGAGQGADTDDLSRGSLGSRDPFIGSVLLPAGNPTGSSDIESGGEAVPPDPSRQLRYYVAVLSNGKLPAPLNAMFDGGTSNAQVRLEPVNSVTRVVEDHIGFTGYTSGPAATKQGVAVPSGGLFNLVSLETHVTPFSLSDVTLFVARGESLVTVDAMRGGIETTISKTSSGGDDLLMRADGRLYSYRGVDAAVANTAGRLELIDSGTGVRTTVGNDSIPDAPPVSPVPVTQTNVATATTGVTVSTTVFNLTNDNITAGSVTGVVRLQYTDNTADPAVNYTGTWGFKFDAGGIFAITATDPSNTAGIAQPQVLGSSLDRAIGLVTIAWNPNVPPAAASLSTVSYTHDPDPNAITTTLVDAMAWDFTPLNDTPNELYYSVREGTKSRLYRANPANGSAAAVDGQPWGRVGGFGGYIQETGNQLGITTGMAFVGGQLYGVDDNGFFFTINTGTGVATLINRPTGVATAFSGLAIGPQNLYDGTLRDSLFAIDSGGMLRAFDTNGDLLQLFDSDNNGSPDATSIDTKATGATGLAFSPLDINLWHPTFRRGSDSGHGVNPTLGTGDNSRDGAQVRQYGTQEFAESAGGASMYFGFEQYVEDDATYAPWGTVGQFGVNSPSWQESLSTNSAFPNTYNLPGGAYGSLTTNSFSLAGSTRADKPTLYFNYFLQSDPAASADGESDTMRDSARVFISQNGGTSWQLLATNNPTKSAAADDDSELPATPSASDDATFLPNQHVQQLYRDGRWRQARVDLGDWANKADLRLRIDFSTAGMFDPTQRDAFGNSINTIDGVANTTGDFGSGERGQNNNYEGFYVDDFIIGFAERGEMVTGAGTGQTDFVTLPAAEPVANKVPSQNLQGQYQLEIRRGTEYGSQPSKQKSDVRITSPFATNDLLTLASGRLGDSNHPREQGQFIIEGNLISNAKTYGISIDSGRDGATNAPSPGVVLNTAAPNSARLVPGVVVTNNVVAGSGTAGIRFSGDANAGAVPVAAVPFGRIVNNTIVGTAKVEGVGIVVSENAGPTLLNNLFANLGTGISVDASSQSNTVVGTSAYWNMGTEVAGISQSQALSLDADPFVNAAAGNYYLKAGSKAIDSGINSLADRPAYVSAKGTLGIPDSPIITPEKDLYGQLRADDPAQASAPGLGSNVFKDRGAIDRIDFTQPFASIAVPLDGSPADENPEANSITLERTDARGVTRFEIQLNDVGIGIDRSTVTSAAFGVMRDGIPLVAGTDYTFNFLESSGRVVFESASVFPMGVYRIVASPANGAGTATTVVDRAGNPLLSNQDDGSTAFEIRLSDVPSAPADFAASLAEDLDGVLSVTLAWAAAAANGSPVIDYVVEEANGTAPAAMPVTVVGGTTHTFTGLVVNSTYSFTVRARNALGSGPTSGVVTFIALPLPRFELEFDSGRAGEAGTLSDNVTNDPTIWVYEGLGAMDQWQYTFDGGTTWGDGDASHTFDLPQDGTYAAGAIGVRRIVGGISAGARFSTVAFTLDRLVAAPTVALVNDTGASSSDGITNDGRAAVGLLEAGTLWEYSTDAGANWTVGAGGELVLPEGVYATNAVRVRQTDLAGNQSLVGSLASAVTVDQTAPEAVLWAITDSGNPEDFVTNSSLVTVSGVEAGARWQYSNTVSTLGQYVDGQGSSFNLPLGASSGATRQIDVAGNIGEETRYPPMGDVILDTTVATPVLTLRADTGISTTDRITKDGTILVAGLEAGGVWEFRTSSAAAWAPLATTSFVLPDGTYAGGQVQVRQTDLAGNASAVGVLVTGVTVDSSVSEPSVTLVQDTGRSATDRVTNNGRVNVLVEAGATWRYSRNSGATWTSGVGTVFTLPAGTYASDAVLVEQTDKAGNSAYTALAAVTVDQAVAKLTLTLQEDTGTPTDGITANGRINVTGLEADATWEYSTNSGTTWTAGSTVDGVAFFVLTERTYSANAIRVRQTDVAGNVAPVSTYPKAITVDVSTPAVVSVSSAVANGVYGFSRTTLIPIRVTFNKPVIVSGAPVLQLNTSPSRSAVYTGGSGTNTLTFTYTIQAGDSSADLGYAATDSLTGGTIVNGAGTAANRELPALGSRLSLNGSKAIVIQTVITASASVGSTVLSTNSGSPTAVTSAVRLITLTFNTDVTGVTLANLRFVKNGSPVAWGATTLTRVNGRTYRIALPTALTTGAGDYRLELGGASSPIASGIRTMTAAAAFSWRQS